MSDRPLQIVVGFYNYADVQALERYTKDAGITILSAVQDAQRLFDDAVNLEADAVLLCPQVTGYRHQLLMDLLLHVAGRQQPLENGLPSPR